MTVSDFLSGVKVLEEVESPINGKIQVVKSLGLGTYIQVEGLTQSGGVVRDVWRTTLRKIRSTQAKGPSASGGKSEIRNCLILGLGGGSAAKLVRNFWPEAKITGIEMDPVMVELGKKYLGLEKVNVKVVVQDALEFLANYDLQITDDFDLILIDLYLGYDVPEKFQSENYIQLVRTVLASGGVAVFNRLYFGEKRKEAEKFGEKLEKIFSKVTRVFPEANVMFVCSS